MPPRRVPHSSPHRSYKPHADWVGKCEE
jgi:hypothetical protein